MKFPMNLCLMYFHSNFNIFEMNLVINHVLMLLLLYLGFFYAFVYVKTKDILHDSWLISTYILGG